MGKEIMADDPKSPPPLPPRKHLNPMLKVAWILPKPEVWKLHQERLLGKTAAQQEVSDVIRTGANLTHLFPIDLVPRMPTVRETMERTLSYADPDYQKRFAFGDKGDKKKKVVKHRQRPIPLGRYNTILMKTLGPQYEYPSGGPTGTTRATTDRLQRKTAAEKLYEDLIEGG